MLLPQWVVSVYLSAASLPPQDRDAGAAAWPPAPVPVVLLQLPAVYGASSSTLSASAGSGANACGGSPALWGLQAAHPVDQAAPRHRSPTTLPPSPGTETPPTATSPQAATLGRLRAERTRGGPSYAVVADEDNDFPPLREVPEVRDDDAVVSARTPPLLWTPEAARGGADHPNDIRTIHPLQGSPPSDLGPQRPHGQFPPGAGPPYGVDLGPQRPHGQFPPGAGPPYGVDLGPQRPHGQLPPNDAVVEVKALPGGTGPRDPNLPSNDAVDLGPHRPAGMTDPNGPLGSNGPEDLGPQRPHGQLPPNDAIVEVKALPGGTGLRHPNLPSNDAVAQFAVDLGPHRPAGMTDPNGPLGSNGPEDLGPQRPSGQFPAGAPRPQHDAVQDDDSSASSYRVHWNVPSFMCHKHGFPFSNLSGRYGMVQNEDDVFRGTKITILYDPGLFPALVNNDGTVIARNGGVPQEGDLNLHLQRLKASIEDQVDEDFDGLGVIDFEAWRPVWAQNFGTLRAYQQYSVEVERSRTPTASNSTLTARATRRFEAAAKVFFLRSLALAQQIRPKGRWGYYAFPYCFNGNDVNYECSNTLRTQNSQIQWLFDASTALYPSVYLTQSGRDRSAQFLFIHAKLKEAARVARGRHVVYPYLWYRYRDASFLSDDDLHSCLALPRAMGFPGAIMWGSSGDMNSQPKCRALNAQLEDRLGPVIREYSATLSDQAVREYVQKRNASATASRRSPTLAGFQFPDLRPLSPLQYSTL